MTTTIGDVMRNNFMPPRLKDAARRFVRADQGNIAVMFGIALVPLLSFVGAAVDYSRALSARSSMQAALDSTALMVAKDLAAGTITSSQVNTKAQSYFAALFTNKETQNLGITGTYTAGSGSQTSTVQVNGSGSITTDFIRVAGFPTINFNTSSTTTWGNVKMRVALALDNTGSMAQSGKITALRNAVAGSGGLIDQLSALAKNDGDVYISVIPFAKVVNVGASNYNQSWIDWHDWLSPPTDQPANAVGGGTQATLPINWHAVGPGAKCPFTNSNGGFTCTTGPNSETSTNYIPSSGTYSGYICPSADANSHTKYNGCWVSTQVTSGNNTQTFCSGSSSCACPVDSSGSAVSGCSCTGNGSSKACSGKVYSHDWTQPTVTSSVGFKDTGTSPATLNKWTPTAAMVANNWTGASTNPTNTWTGCVADRDQPYDVTGNTAQPFPANEYYENSIAYCDSNASNPLKPIIPLSYNWSALKTAVNAMQPTGGTNQAVGMAWAWQSLLPGGPLNAPTEDGNTTYNRVIILLSDGLNTEDRWPAYGNGSSQASGNPIDVRQAQLCTNLKNATDAKGNPMYTIYTIQVNTSSPADPTSTVLQNCASSSDKFFMLTSSSQILTTFNTIGTALSKLRVAM